MSWIKRTTPTDTGTLDITTIATGMTAGTWTLRRIGRFVYMNLDNGQFTVEAGTAWASPSGMIPLGFRPVAVPPYVTYPSATRGTLSLSPGGLRVSRYGGVDVYDVASKRSIVNAIWVTDDAWPTILPGVSV